MPSPFKHISQVQASADFAKLTKQIIGKIGEEPVKVQYFPKFKFDKKEGPLLLIGDVPTPVLAEVKKTAGTPLLGQCSLNLAKQLVFEGAVKSGTARKCLQAMGIQNEVASTGDDEVPKAPATPPAGDTKTATAKAGTATPGKPAGTTPLPRPTSPAPATPPKAPATPPKPPGSAAGSTAATAKAAPAAKAPAPVAPPRPSTPAPATKPAPPTVSATPGKPPTAPPPPAASKEEVAQRLQAILPLFQQALNVPGVPEAKLKSFFGLAVTAAKKGNFRAANTSLTALEKIVRLTLAKVKAPTNAPPADASAAPEVKGAYAKSRQAWQQATRAARAEISALQAAILKTGDPRAATLASGFGRILKKLPDPSPALGVLAQAAEKKDTDSVERQKTVALRLAKSCQDYLGADRLVALAGRNPFVPVKLADHFKGALQTLHAEL